MSSDTAYDPRYLEGIAFFNECEFFEAHEAWEALWADVVGSDRRFYQGLIQMAVCLHHFGNGNLRGTRKLFFSCQKYLDAYRPAHLGIDLDKLLAELAFCCEEIVTDDEPAAAAEIDVERIPEIHLESRA